MSLFAVSVHSTDVTSDGRNPSNRAVPGFSFFWLLGIVTAILYGSLIPFQFDWSRFDALNGWGLRELQFRGTTVEDIITNLIVYVPLGLAFVLCGDQRMNRRLVRAVPAIGAGALVSLLAELLQTGIAIRVASLTDVTLNVIGTAGGVILGLAIHGFLTRTIGRLRRGMRDRPTSTIARVLTVSLLVYGLVPFDFVTSSASLHDSFRQARWNLTEARLAGPGQAPLEPLISQMTSAAWFALLGYLSVASARKRERHNLMAAWTAAVRNGLMLAGIIELMQLFTLSHRFDLAVLILRSLAVILGASFALFVWRRWRGPIATVRLGTLGGLSLLALLGLLQIVALPLSSFDWSLLSLRAVDLASIRWIPFEALWHRPMARAASDIITSLVTFGSMAATIGFVLQQARIRFAWILTGLSVTLVSFIVEGLRFYTPTRTADCTGPILAILSVILVWRWFSLLNPPAGQGVHVER